jgi:serine/threonine-protein kinase PpkA
MSLQIPGYTIVRPIAEGGMASVYLAVQQSLDRQVALKLLKNIDNPAQLERFHNEGRIIASLNHRNIITIHDTGVVGGHYYISMEYLEGGDLEDRIAAGISHGAALNLLEVIGSCLDFLHRKNIIHRDIKPANILFHTDGTPILTDFGIAKQREIDTRLTLENTALGSPYYLSPEQAESKSLDGRADIYGLGIILYEMLTGTKPYQGASPIETILAHLTDPLPSLPTELRIYQDLLERMIAKNRDDRFESAGEMVNHIRELRQAGRITARKKSGLTEYLRSHRGLGLYKSIATQIIGYPGKTGLLQNIAIRAVNIVRTAYRKIGRFIIGNTRMRYTGAVAMAVLIAVTLGMLMINPSYQTARKQSANASTTTTNPELTRNFVFAGRTTPAYKRILSNEPEFQFVEYLHLAKQSLDEYRLTTPDKNNAFYFYQLILEQDPDNEEALEGIKQIANIYADMAEKELDIFRYARAKSYINRGLTVDPNNQRLLELDRTEALADASRRFIGKVKSLFQ